MLIFTLFFSFLSIFIFVIPKLKTLLSNVENQSYSTKSMFFIENIISNNYSYIVLFMFVLIFIFMFFYKNNDFFRYQVFKFFNEKTFIFKEIYQSIEFYKLFLVLSVLLRSNYEFHKAIKFSKILIKDKYLLDKIQLIESLLENGKSISYSFLKTKIFDDITINLLNTAQRSNSMPFAVDKIKEIYKNRFYEKIEKLLSLIEPTIMIFIVSLVLWVVFAIFVPLWDSSNMLGM